MSKWEQAFRSVLVVAITVTLGLGTALSLYVLVLLFTLPSPAELQNINLTESTLIMDRDGELLYAVHGEENRNALDDLGNISPLLVEATVSIEDDRFYKHIGIDIPALVKAVASEVGIGSPRGGSTITQQFVKNTFLSSERTYSRKLKEVILSLLVELRFSKDEIMLMYLNAIPYGSNAYGIEVAAERYFEKAAKDLTLGESAILASIPKAPTRYSPYGNYRYSTLAFELTEDSIGDRKITGEADLEYEEWTRGLLGKTFEMPNGESFYIKGRSDLVLERMLDLENISQSEFDVALDEIKNISFTPYSETIKAPHFVLWVKQMLEEKYGAAVVEQGGLKVYTTLDFEMQKEAEAAINKQWEANTKYGADNAAMVVLDPETGQILTMVGSAGFFDKEDKVVTDGQVNMATSLRQPGSSFKPFIYALSFLNQFTPATVIYDVPTSFGTDRPKNYDGQFHGSMSMRRALAQSRNIPAAKAYFMAGQQEAIIPFVKPFGFDQIQDEGDYGWPLALGTAEVTPLQLAEAYAVFASGGIHMDSTPILRIENADGDILEEWTAEQSNPKEVLDPQVAYLINDILSDPSVNLGPQVRIDTIDNAAKTGTSTNNEGKPTNAWLAAYTPKLVSITWVGNADSTAMSLSAGGYTNAAPIWKSFMSNILDKLESTSWNRPAGIKDIAVSKASGKLPSKQTPSEMIATEIFASFAVPTEIDNSYQTLMIETISNRIATEYSPADVLEEKNFIIHRSPLASRWPHWQAAIDEWAKEQGEEVSTPPSEIATDIHNEITSKRIPQLVILSPSTNSSIEENAKTLDIEVDILDPGNGIKEVKFYINGNIQYREQKAPYQGFVRIPTTSKDGDILEIEVRIVDIYGYSSSSSIEVKVVED
jgi:membrane peptidoglycan carboxypeptidase